MTEKLLNNLEHTGLFVGILVVSAVVAFLVNRFFKRLIRRSTQDMNNDPTNYLFLRHAMITLIYLVGFSIAIFSVPQLRTLASSLLAGAGILAVVVGFASQHALSNVISGIFIVIYKPFKVNDQITIRNMTGTIEDITLRHTVIRDFENRRIIIPNTLISQEYIINSHLYDDRICKWIDIPISFDSNLAKAKEIIREEILRHPLHLDVRTADQIQAGEPEVIVRVLRLNQYSVDLRGWAWAQNPPDAFVMACDLNEAIKYRFDAEPDIEIPYPHHTVIQKKSD